MLNVNFDITHQSPVLFFEVSGIPDELQWFSLCVWPRTGSAHCVGKWFIESERVRQKG